MRTNAAQVFCQSVVIGMGAAQMASGSTSPVAEPSEGVTVRANGFEMGGKPFQIISGEMHFARIPRAYWRHRLQMARAMGLNTVCAYLFWDLHEPRPGEYVFTGDAEAAAFVRLAAEEGLKVILRPGPYACAEWDFGGLPPWLLATRDLRVRCMDARFTEPMRRYLRRVGEELAPLQATRGGPIILVQVENEYGSYGSDRAYLELVRDSLREAGFDVPLFTCDGPGAFSCGSVAGAFPVVNFGDHPADSFRQLRDFSPDTPAACGEYYPGWFDHWGEPHQTRDAVKMMDDIRWMLERGASFSIYMFHGGTSFGFAAGANTGENGEYQPTVTSYDYDAPLDEAGRPTGKYFQLRALLQKHLAAPLPPMPAAMPVITIPPFALAESAALWENLPEPKHDVQPQPMEVYGQDYGLILYRSTLRAGRAGPLTIRDVHDYGLVSLDGRPIAALDRRLGQNRVAIPVRERDAQLDILVEAMGRVNYGPALLDRKGITERVEFPVPFAAGVVMGWEVFLLPLDAAQLVALKYRPGVESKNGPTFFRGILTLSRTGDTFLDLRGWGKGHVWINGHHLGRFWKIGPQQTLYVPGCWLRSGSNEVVVFDLEPMGHRTLTGLPEPILAAQISEQR